MIHKNMQTLLKIYSAKTPRKPRKSIVKQIAEIAKKIAKRCEK